MQEVAAVRCLPPMAQDWVVTAAHSCRSDGGCALTLRPRTRRFVIPIVALVLGSVSYVGVLTYSGVRNFIAFSGVVLASGGLFASVVATVSLWRLPRRITVTCRGIRWSFLLGGQAFLPFDRVARIGLMTIGPQRFVAAAPSNGDSALPLRAANWLPDRRRHLLFQVPADESRRLHDVESRDLVDALRNAAAGKWVVGTW